MTHQLTDEQRRLLDGVGYETIDNALDIGDEMGSTEIGFLIEENPDGSFDWHPSYAKSGAYIPTHAIRAWLAEQDAKEAEIERRIGEAISLKSEVVYFNDWERTADTFFVSEEGLLYRRVVAAPLTAIPVPRERIRAALDRHRAEQADHIADASKMAHDDQSGDGNGMIRYPDEVGEDEGPWRVKMSCREYAVMHNDLADAVFLSSGTISDSEAREEAHGLANRFNAKWRTEERARRRDIAHGEALEEDKRRAVTISPELRARLEKLFALSVKNPFYCISLKESRHITSDGQSLPQKQRDSIYCTPDQARAFLRDKGIEVPND